MLARWFCKSPGVTAMIESLDHPDQWTANHHLITHRASKRTFWISNGWLFFDGDDSSYANQLPTPAMFSLWERWLLWPHVRRMIQRLVGQELLQDLKKT